MNELLFILWLLAGFWAFAMIAIPAKDALEDEPPERTIFVFLFCEMLGPFALVLVLMVVFGIKAHSVAKELEP